MEVKLEICPRCSQLQQAPSNRILHITKTLSTQFLLTVLFLVVFLIDKGLPSDLTNTPTFKPQDIKEFKDATNSKYFRYLQIDKNQQYLYVGSMEYLYRLSLSDISQVPKHIHLPATISDIEKCKVSADRSVNFDCKNHIRSVTITSDSIIVCGTGAFAPRDDVLDKNDLSVKTAGKSLSGKFKCPYNPNDNATSIYVETGNPSGVPSVYTGTGSQFDGVIYRPQLNKPDGAQASTFLITIPHDTKWLNEPNFVGSFEVGQYVYFFFRESAVEYTNCGKAVFSRVARVCKNDRGGLSALEDRWSTYLKARLNCSFSGDYPFYFHEIYDIKRIRDTFYAVFTTNNVEGLFGSAVCAFTEADIEEAFSGTFKEQLDSSSLWLPVPNERIPKQRPGQCVNDSTNLPDNVVQFIKARPLMDKAVAHTNSKSGKPLFYSSGVIYNSIAVDTLNYGGATYKVYFLGTAYGHIHKVVQWSEVGQASDRLLAIWKPFGDKVVTIRQMKFYNKNLYVATDDEVTQISVEQCGSYSVCDQCAYDPYCGWHSWDKKCALRSSAAINNVKGDKLTLVCNSNTCLKQSTAHPVNVRVPGDPVYLHCDTHCPTDSVLWYQHTTLLSIDNTKYFLSHNQGLMVFNVTAADQALYTCRSSTTGIELAKHEVTLSKCGDNTTCLWQEEFRNWCSEFDAYKKQFNNWVCLKNNCLQDNSCMPSRVSGSCPLSP